MKKFLPVALAAFLLVGVASAQNLPAIDVFGGYSYLSFNLPASADTTSQRLGMQGWDGSVSVGLFQHLAVEGDISGHSLTNCGGTTNLNCSNFSYMAGPRYNFGDRGQKFTGFVHAIVGQDRATLQDTAVGTNSSNDTSVAFAGGAGVNYWATRHIGLQIGPFDYFYTHHLNTYGVPSQSSYRFAAGIAFRFGGELPEPKAKAEPAPQPPPQTQTESSTSHRSLRHPFGGGGKKTKTVAAAPAASQPTGIVNIPGRGLSISSLGAILAPQEFDGAKVVEIVRGGVAEMASLKPGDLIKSVDGKAVRTPMELAAELSDKSGKVHIGFTRGDFATETVILLGR